MLRASHYPLLTGDTFRAFCDHHIDETCVDFDPSFVQKGDTIFVGMGYLRFFLDTIVPEIKHPFIMVTSNGHGFISDIYLPYLEDGKIFHWFGRNILIKHPKLTCIPLGVSWLHPKGHPILNAYFSNLSIQHYFADKPIYSYLAVNNTSPARLASTKYFAKQSFCTVASKMLPFDQYMQTLRGSRFVMSPRGFNIDCFRTWEALYAGSIPVVESLGIDSIYEGLPVIIVKNMLKVTKELLDAEFEKLKQKTFDLRRLHPDYWFDKIKEKQHSVINGNTSA